jgi:formylmethanofuran dehydrogenase subunit E
MIENQRSHLPILCLQCANRWYPTINHHINNETGCPECYGNIPWTLERFVPRAIQIHGNKYDYTNITADMFHGKGSHLPMKCNTCFYYWSPRIDDHINNKSGCPDCAGKAPWTLDRFLTRAANVHGDKYDYTLITEDHIRGYQSQVPVLCKTCHNIWNPRIGNHISGKQGCKHCNRSYGELSCESYFNTNNISYKREFILDNLPRKRFDFRFSFNNKWFLLEFDGKQHFEFVPFYHGEEEFFQEKQQVDILKTRKGLEAGYHIIRIDYTQIGTIAQHIESAINGSDIVYVSNTEMYQFILNNIK